MTNRKSKRFIIFLYSRYGRNDNAYYLKQLSGKISIAADGGIRFFRKNKIRPDILIGDFDSVPRLPENYLRQIEVIKYPSDKDKTDSQLAIELALDRGAQEIEICGGLSESEIDHTISNIFLLELIKRYGRKQKQKIVARIISSANEICLLDNESMTLTGHPGGNISFIPLEDNCRIDFEGLIYPIQERKLIMGDTLTLRNRFRRKQARISVTGKILAVTDSKQ